MTPREPTKMCPVCHCCSMRDGKCVGSCEPCGHHVPCPDCEQFGRERLGLADIVQGFIATLKDFERRVL